MNHSLPNPCQRTILWTTILVKPMERYPHVVSAQVIIRIYFESLGPLYDIKYETDMYSSLTIMLLPSQS